MKRIKKIRKELEKWLKIPKILVANKVYEAELKAKNKVIDELNEKIINLEVRIKFFEINNEKLNSQVIKLKREIENEQK